MHKKLSHALHEGHTVAHMLYFAFVAIEAHGYYGIAAGVVLGITLLGEVIGESL